jgi:hypothetical protein
MTTITGGTIITELVGAYLGCRFLLQRGMVNVEPNQTKTIQFLRVDGRVASRAFLAARRASRPGIRLLRMPVFMEKSTRGT